MAKKKHVIGPRKEIHIIADDGSVGTNARRQKVKKGVKEQATWVSDTGNRFTIFFNKGDGSPFVDDVFQVPAGGEVGSGPFRKDWPTNKEFKYAIAGTAGVNDPVIIVDN